MKLSGNRIALVATVIMLFALLPSYAMSNVSCDTDLEDAPNYRLQAVCIKGVFGIPSSNKPTTSVVGIQGRCDFNIYSVASYCASNSDMNFSI